MKKGNFGFRLSLYTVLAFILAYFGNSTVLFLLAGAVFFLEKDEWAGRQIIQAICLCFARSLVSTILSMFNPVGNISIPLVSRIWSMSNSLINSIVSMLVLVFCVVGIINNLKGKDAKIIGASKLADWAYGSINSSKESA